MITNVTSLNFKKENVLKKINVFCKSCWKKIYIYISVKIVGWRKNIGWQSWRG